MSQLNAKTLMLGQNADQSKNFKITVPTPEDGTLTIERANGADVMKFLAAGGVEMPSLGKSLGANADVPSWFELPNGIIIQTGPVPAVSAGGGVQVNFPKVFPTACLSVAITSVISAGSTNVYSLCLDAALPAASAFGVRNPWTGGALGGRYIAIGY